MTTLIPVLIFSFFVLMGNQSQAQCAPQKMQDKFGNSISYFPSSKNPDFAVLLLPPTGGENFTDRSLARSLCQEGISAYIFNYQQYKADLKNLKSHDQISAVTFGWIEEFLQSRPESQWGIMGSSLGGMYASMIFGIGQGAKAPHEFPSFSKFKSAVLVVAGGSLAEVLATSQQAGVVEQRNFRMKHLGLKSVRDYQDLLKENIQYDPLRLSTAVASENVLVFASITDDDVPSKTQQQLWESWGQAEKTEFSTGHAFTIGRVYLSGSSEIARFFLK